MKRSRGSQSHHAPQGWKVIDEVISHHSPALGLALQSGGCEQHHCSRNCSDIYTAAFSEIQTRNPVRHRVLVKQWGCSPSGMQPSSHVWLLRRSEGRGNQRLPVLQGWSVLSKWRSKFPGHLCLLCTCKGFWTCSIVCDDTEQRVGGYEPSDN